MLEIKNVHVYDLKESIVSCRNAMRTEMPVNGSKETGFEEEYEKSLERAKKLVKTSKNDKYAKCHDNFLTGIRVSFDMKYSQYITKQMQRYHWFDYVSSSSLMHCITKMNFDKCCNEYVSEQSKSQMRTLIDEYNDISKHIKEITDEHLIKELKEKLYKKYMEIISNCPMGVELFVHISTNYKQLQTMYHQRKNHKLKEDWGAFCKFVEELPFFKEFILGE